MGPVATSAFVVANMIGTGVFTSLGLQLLTTTNPVSIIILWMLGGLTAVCGALCYGELGAAMPRSGGEYHYLSVIYGPATGFLSGWVSLVVGFAAPVALSCMAVGEYLGAVLPLLQPKVMPLAVLFGITLIHSISVKVGTVTQVFLTSLKVVLIIAFIIAGFLVPTTEGAVLTCAEGLSFSDILSPGFAVALIYVYYAYPGWNAAAYIASDLKNPQKNLPVILLASTLTVMVLYVLLNVIFMKSAPLEEMVGEVEIGVICASHIFGAGFKRFVGIFIAFMLISSISSMIFIGPRVAMTMGEDHPSMKALSRKSSSGNPRVALWVQCLISAVLILTDSFELVTKYTGVLLSVFGLLAVVGVIVHRRKFPSARRPYRTFAYPLPIILFSVVILWSIGYLVYEDYVNTYVLCTQSFMWITAMSVLTLFAGYLIYLIDLKLIKRNNRDTKNE